MRIQNRLTVEEVAAKWELQYSQSGWPITLTRPSRETHQQLLAAKTADDCDEIIGNNGWSRERCCECRDYKSPAIVFSDGDTELNVCLDCFARAVEVINKLNG